MNEKKEKEKEQQKKKEKYATSRSKMLIPNSHFLPGKAFFPKSQKFFSDKKP